MEFLMNPISLAEYAAECTAIAREIVEECEGDEDTINDRLHETVDGHQWIIYTYYNAQVLTHSRNKDAYFENFGKLEVESYSDAMAKMAYAALEADVRAELDSALEWYRNPPVFTIQVRKPGGRYELVGKESTLASASWILRQYLVPNSRNSVRVLNENGEVVAQATPKKR